MTHLYVNGSSFATGWNEEYKHMSTVTPAPSYAEILAEKLGAEKLYKHCYNGKAPQSSIEQTIEFCEAYKRKYGSTDNLKVVIELTILRYKQWTLIKDINGEPVQPVAYIQYEDIRSHNQYFLKRKLLDNLEEVVEEVSVDSIPESELKKYEAEMIDWYPPGRQFEMITAMKYYDAAIEQFEKLTTYCNSNNIDYLAWWIPGKRNPQTRYRRTIDGISKRYGNRIVSPGYFCGQEIAANDKTGYRGHPGPDGHKEIADNIFDYASSHNLLGVKNG